MLTIREFWIKQISEKQNGEIIFPFLQGGLSFLDYYFGGIIQITL